MVLLAIVHNSAMNMRMLITSRNPDSTVFGYIPRCEIVGSYVIFLSKLHTVFHRGFAIIIFPIGSNFSTSSPALIVLARRFLLTCRLLGLLSKFLTCWDWEGFKMLLSFFLLESQVMLG